MDEESKQFQRRLAGDQIIISGIITIGCTVFAIGAALWILTITVLDDLFSKGITTFTFTSNNTALILIPNGTNFDLDLNKSTILNLDALNSMIELFVISGLILVVLGFILASTIHLRKTKEKSKKGYCTACPSSNPNPLPCEIHENKYRTPA